MRDAPSITTNDKHKNAWFGKTKPGFWVRFVGDGVASVMADHEEQTL